MNNLKTVIVNGNSMGRYLRSGDLLLYDVVRDEDASFEVGELLLIKREGELVVHRYTGSSGVKGDVNKCYDIVEEIVGVVRFRLYKNKTVDYRRDFVKLLSYLIAKLSIMNKVRADKLDKVFFIFILVTTNLFRLVENIFLSRDHHETC